jgi:hypothetical protein
VIKTDELQQGCMARALDEEMTFVLLARDAAAPAAIRAWCEERIGSGRNNGRDHQIIEARICANEMERQRDEIRKKLGDQLKEVQQATKTYNLDAGVLRLRELEATERRYKALAQPGRYVYKLSDGSGWLLCALGEDKPISKGATPEEAIDAAIERKEKT